MPLHCAVRRWVKPTIGHNWNWNWIGWKKRVNQRMRYLDKSERQQSHRYVWGPNDSMIDRNESRVIDLVCRYEGCGKLCKLKGGLV